MDLKDKSPAELNDMLIKLASNLKEEDLHDPATFGLVSQLVDVMEPKPHALPPEVIEQIKNLPTKEDRFRTAAQSMGLDKPETLNELAQAMRAQGLLSKSGFKPKVKPNAESDSIQRAPKPPTEAYKKKSAAYLKSKNIIVPPQATEPFPPKEEDMSEKNKTLARAKAIIEKSELKKMGQDGQGNGIKGSNKRYQQAKVFGTKSDVKTKVKADGSKVHSYKIPDANGKRVSEQRMKMMNTIKDYADKKMGANMVVAEGKRDESGKLKAKAPIEKQPYDVFSAKGHKQEKARQTKIDSKNANAPAGAKPIKRVDPKPDHRSGNLETQPSPDAAVHEIAHEALAPKGMSMAQHQTHMDKQWGQSQKDHGHMQQKKTAGEIQPMAAENPIRREMGLPANKTSQKVKDASKPVEQTVDGTGPRFVRAKDKKGRATDLMRQSRLLHPENKARIDSLRDGTLKHTPEGIKEGTSVDAKINARAKEKAAAPKASVPVIPADKKQEEKPMKDSKKLAASELAPGMSYNDMKKAAPSSQDLYPGQSYNDLKKADGQSQKNKKVKEEKGVHKPAFAHNYESGTSDVGARMAPGGASKQTNAYAKEEHKAVLAEAKAMKKPNLPKSEAAVKKAELPSNGMSFGEMMAMEKPQATPAPMKKSDPAAVPTQRMLDQSMPHKEPSDVPVIPAKDNSGPGYGESFADFKRNNPRK